MAARRLIIVLLVLFGISIAAAMIAPDRRGTLIGDRSDSTTSTTTTTSSTTTADRLPPGESVTARIDASAAKPEAIEAFVSDQLELSVGSDRGRLVEIPAFGVTEDAAPDAPARFNLLLREAGSVAIRDAESGTVLGRLVVSEPKRSRDRG